MKTSTKKAKDPRSPAKVLSELQSKYDLIVGIDEAGWGPIAGPLVVAGCAFTPDLQLPKFIKDSKLLSEKRREEAFHWIVRNTQFFTFAMAPATDFVHGASRVRDLLFEKVAWEMHEIVHPHTYAVVVDGSYLPPRLPSSAVAMVKADVHSPAVAAASILAKVTRDGIMVDLAKDFPEFEWEKNKGYSTKEHLQAIEKFGITSEHRMNIKRLKEHKPYGPARTA